MPITTKPEMGSLADHAERVIVNKARAHHIGTYFSLGTLRSMIADDFGLVLPPPAEAAIYERTLKAVCRFTFDASAYDAMSVEHAARLCETGIVGVGHFPALTMFFETKKGKRAAQRWLKANGKPAPVAPTDPI